MTGGVIFLGHALHLERNTAGPSRGRRGELRSPAAEGDVQTA